MSEKEDLSTLSAPEDYEKFLERERRANAVKKLKAKSSMLALLDGLRENIIDWLQSEGLYFTDDAIESEMSECRFLIYDKKLNYHMCGLNGKECEVSNCGETAIQVMQDSNTFYDEAVFNASWAAMEELIKVLPYPYELSDVEELRQKEKEEL